MEPRVDARSHVGGAAGPHVGSSLHAGLGAAAQVGRTSAQMLASSKDAREGEGGKEGISTMSTMRPVARYAPLEGCFWDPGRPVPYLFLARTFHEVFSTTKRGLMQDAMTNYFRTILAVSFGGGGGGCSPRAIGITRVNVGICAVDMHRCGLRIGYYWSCRYVCKCTSLVYMFFRHTLL